MTVERSPGPVASRGTGAQSRPTHRLTNRWCWEFFTYQPRFTVLLSTNHLPNIEGVDRGLWRRLLVLPFEVAIAEPDQDPHLLGKLRAELAGILSWIVEGCLEWQRVGLEPPMSVQMATAEYHDDVDVIGQFVEERLVAEAEAWVGLQEVYAAYRLWAEDSGYPRLTAQQLSNRLREHGLRLTKDAPRTHRSRLRGHRIEYHRAGPQGGSLT